MSAPLSDSPLSSIFRSEAPKHAGPEGSITVKEFAPWHLPRKSWVRFYQWGRQADKLIQEINPADRPIRYLTLPGAELLDVRVMQHVCKQRGKDLRFLGFNKTIQSDPAATETNISLDEVRRMDGVRSDSSVRGFDVLDLATPKSRATILVQEFGDFDIINLDLCDSIGTNAGTQPAQYHKALNSLLTHQARKRSEPWVLFLTTRADHQTIPAADVVSYWPAIRSNALASANFAVGLDAMLGPQAADFRMDEAAVAGIEQARLHRLICLGFGKWLLNFMLSAQPRWSVQMLEGGCYRVHNDDPDMLSLGFRFTQNFVPPIDPAQIVQPPAPEAPHPDEVALAEKLILSIGSLIDIDRLIAGDAALRQKLVNKTVPLFKTARLPIDPIESYLAWAASREPVFN